MTAAVLILKILINRFSPFSLCVPLPRSEFRLATGREDEREREKNLGDGIFRLLLPTSALRYALMARTIAENSPGELHRVQLIS